MMRRLFARDGLRGGALSEHPRVLGARADRDFHADGDVCTRHCGFCAVGQGTAGLPRSRGAGRVAEGGGRARVSRTRVVTSVATRDDLARRRRRRTSRRRSGRSAPEAPRDLHVEVLIPGLLRRSHERRSETRARRRTRRSCNHNRRDGPPPLNRACRTRGEVRAVRSSSSRRGRRRAPPAETGSATMTKSGIMVGAGRGDPRSCSRRSGTCDRPGATSRRSGSTSSPTRSGLPVEPLLHARWEFARLEKAGERRWASGASEGRPRSCAPRTTAPPRPGGAGGVRRLLARGSSSSGALPSVGRDDRGPSSSSSRSPVYPESAVQRRSRKATSC
jgi:hypothetical protein